ncbi:MAG TPA: glycosyltransferase family 4 protein [Candidatus Cybelea sp.]|nr:glycosyltransferase family 4 protein [Candidatus Cybelea sp.]
MKVLVTLEDHLWRHAPEGVCGHGPAGYDSWSELLEVFEQVVLLARVQLERERSPDGLRIDGPSISVVELPDYVGPWEYLTRQPVLRHLVRKAVADCDAFLLRVPGLVAYLAWHEVKRRGRPYAVDVVGDPWDAFGPGTMTDPFRPLYRFWATHSMKAICARADAALYCSNGALRERYLVARDVHSAIAPRIHLLNGYASPELMAKRSGRSYRWPTERRPLRLGFVGSLAQLYKGPDILLRATRIVVQAGIDIEVFLVGEGRYRERIESLAQGLGIDKRVFFLGQLPFGKAIFDFLDSLDLFIMPSRAEAFGRALLEAMARGCPCIGADVGGIRSLLDRADLFPCGDPESLASKILEVTARPERMAQMSARNLERAKEFNPEVLAKRRRDFFRAVRISSERSAAAG